MVLRDKTSSDEGLYVEAVRTRMIEIMELDLAAYKVCALKRLRSDFYLIGNPSTVSKRLERYPARLLHNAP